MTPYKPNVQKTLAYANLAHFPINYLLFPLAEELAHLNRCKSTIPLSSCIQLHYYSLERHSFEAWLELN